MEIKKKEFFIIILTKSILELAIPLMMTTWFEMDIDLSIKKIYIKRIFQGKQRIRYLDELKILNKNILVRQLNDFLYICLMLIPIGIIFLKIVDNSILSSSDKKICVTNANDLDKKTLKLLKLMN